MTTPFLDEPRLEADASLWDEMPAVSSSSSKGPDVVASHNAALAQELLAAAEEKHVEHKRSMDAWGTGQIVSGALLVVLSTIWLGAGILVGRIQIYPAVMLVTGAVALINGVAQKLQREP